MELQADLRLWAVVLVAAMLWTASVAAQSTTSAASASVVLRGLRCEHRVDPLGVDNLTPRLTWRLEAIDLAARGIRQTAYQVLVATSTDKLAPGRADLWDSGKVASDQSVLVPYGGAALNSAQRVHWTVRIWDEADRVTEFAAPSTWTMGLLAADDWRAKWIAAEDLPAAKKPTQKLTHPTVLLRRTFEVRAGLTRATAFVCGLGQYELSVNGTKAGEDLLSPGWTDYRKTCLYDTRDVTLLLKAGEPNAIGLILGGGMYDVRGGRYAKFTNSFGAPKAIIHLRLDYADGTHEIVASDDQWQTAPGPITFSDVFGGEDHDARLEQSGWDQSSFDAATWKPAIVVASPGGTLRGTSSAAAPIRSIEQLRPVATKEIRPGVTVYDFGQNTSMMPRVTMLGPAGSTIRIVPAELVKTDGSIDPGNVGAPCWWQYALAGRGSETWFPKFYYRGARYLQVESTGGATVDAIEAHVVHSTAEPVGEFESSNELFARIRQLVRWAQRSNLMSVITDCPHREKLSWLEQYHLNGPSLRYEWNLATLFEKTLQDMADAQLPNGLVPDIAPEFVVFSGGFRDSPEWGSAIILSAWQQYQFHGDVGILTRHYDAMKRYVDYLTSRSKDGIVDHGLGDWYDVGPKPPGESQLTPRALTATAIYFEDLSVLAKMARLIGKPDDATALEARAKDVRAAYIAKFRDSETGKFATNSQASNAITLVLGLCEEIDRPAVLAALVKDIQDRGNANTGGDVGYRYVLRALSDGGRSDVVYAMNNQSEKPGYGFQLKRGATSLSEAWDASPSSSQNHFMLGQIIEWFYHDLAGIQCDPAGPGFRKIIIKPAIVEGLTSASGSHASAYGVIKSAWSQEGDAITLNVDVPPNTTATIHLPAKDVAEIEEGGMAISQSRGAKLVGSENGIARIQVGSGRYVFESSR